jgi:hypothetical protein
MKNKYKKIISKHHDFKNSFLDAYIGIPQGIGGLEKCYFGTLRRFRKLYPHFHCNTKTPTVFFMHGSAGLKKGATYRKWIVTFNKFIFFAPNSMKISNRPCYTNPATHKEYEKVHNFRQAEIYYNLKHMEELSFIDTDNLFLMGNSEGGLAVAIFKDRIFKGRIITAYSCENGYYSKDFKLGISKKEPVLNIIGTHDEYFAKDAKTTKKYDEVEGHCTKALFKYPKAKVTLLPKTKHDITLNPYVKYEVISFLKLWSKS